MTRPIKYYSDQWNTAVLLFIGPQEDFIKYMKKRFGAVIQSQEDPSIQGYALRLQAQDVRDHIQHVIFLPSFSGSAHDLQVLSHECLHAACRILNDRQVETKDQGNQALAYTHGSIYRYFLKKLMKGK